MIKVRTDKDVKSLQYIDISFKTNNNNFYHLHDCNSDNLTKFISFYEKIFNLMIERKINIKIRYE